MVNDSRYDRENKVFDRFQFDLDSRAVLLIQTYPFSQFLSADGKQIKTAGTTSGQSKVMETSSRMNKMADKQGKLKGDRSALTWQYLRHGLTCVISVKLLNPEFEGPIKWKLANPEVQEIVESLVEKAFTEYLELHPQLADAILDKAQTPGNKDDNWRSQPPS